MTMFEPPEEFASNFAIARWFAAAGWTASRYRAPRPSIPAGHPASEILSRYEGLHVRPNSVAGDQCATSDIAFKYVAADEPVAEWAARLGVRLIGIAEAGNAYEQVWVSNDDRYFTTDCIDDTFAYVATGFQSMVRNLLGGMHIQPLLPPGTVSVTVYGISLSAPDARIYDWKTTVADSR